MRSTSRAYGSGYGVTMGDEVCACRITSCDFLLFDYWSIYARTIARCQARANVWVWFLKLGVCVNR